VFFEIFAFFGIGIVILVLMAELGQKPFFGIAASVLLLVLSFWVAIDSIQFPYATQIITTGTIVQPMNYTTEIVNIYNLNETTTTLYQDLPEITPVIETKHLLWLVLLLCSLYGLLSYAEDIRATAKR